MLNMWGSDPGFRLNGIGWFPRFAPWGGSLFLACVAGALFPFVAAILNRGQDQASYPASGAAQQVSHRRSLDAPPAAAPHDQNRNGKDSSERVRVTRINRQR
jgi:hypothetical protein